MTGGAEFYSINELKTSYNQLTHSQFLFLAMERKVKSVHTHLIMFQRATYLLPTIIEKGKTSPMDSQVEGAASAPFATPPPGTRARLD